MNTPKQLTIEHLAAYLPYGLKVAPIFGGYAILDVENIDRVLAYNKPVKPILRPLSDLTKEITHNGEAFVPIYRIDEMGYRIHGLTLDGIGLLAMPYWVVCKLHSWHFDIYGLIDAGLAIDINTINK